MAANGRGSSSSESSVSGGSRGVGEGEEDWRQRCEAMEASLLRFKQQAARIRTLLADKMQTLEERTKDAETRATAAEDQNTALATRLSASGARPEEMDKRLHQLETGSREKDEEIAQLQQALLEQQRLRYQEAKLLEEKSSKIKQWVTKKWKTLEAANRQLESDNSLLQSQVTVLRARLQALPAATARAIHHASIQGSETDSTVSSTVAPPMPDRPTDSLLELVRMQCCAESERCSPERVVESSERDGPASPPPLRRVAPPCVRIERRLFPAAGGSYSPSVASSTTGSEELLDAPETWRTHATLPRSVSAIVTLPRRKRDAASRRERDATADRRLQAAAAESGSRSLLQVAPPQATRSTKPPTPPMRRLPSWETQIYAVATVGLRMPDEDGNMKRDSTFPVTDGLYTDQMYHDLSVPVYTTIKGRAAQIRDTPFTGDTDSDSSSDDEMYSHVPLPTNHSGLPSHMTGPRVVVGAPSPKPMFAGAMKRGVSSQSVGSETSSDYAVPPDELLLDSSDNSEPEHKLLKCSADAKGKGSLEKSGFLTKLGAKMKSFRKRYFVLHNTELLYYKSPNVSERPCGRIQLDGQTRVARMPSSNLTFQIATQKRIYHLSAESTHDMEQWVKVLHNVLRKQTCEKVMGCSRGQEVMKSWILKTKQGRSRRCWCVLIGRFIVYYKHPDDKMPLGQIALRDALIQEVDRSCDSESESDDSTSRVAGFTVAVRPATQHDATYLRMTTQREKDSWLYHLTVASGGGLGNVGTDYEQLVSKLMEVDGEPGCMYWKHPTLLYTRDLLTYPLTSLPSEKLCRKSLELFRTCQQFVSVAVESTHLEFHVSLAQSILDLCVAHAPLQNELYCQLIKQTSPHIAHHKTHVPNFLLCAGQSWFMCDAAGAAAGAGTLPGAAPGAAASQLDLSDPKVNATRRVHLQGWQLLAMAVSLFVPSHSVLWYLRAHLQRHANPRCDIGQYAVFCERGLQRTQQQGPREARPSRMEVLSILRNPYHHSQPLSVPVHLVNTTYQVISFDGSTTVDEFVATLNRSINMRECHLSGFAVFTDDPAGQELEHCLKGNLKLCDVISKWEQAFLHHASLSGRPDMSRTVKLTYKNRLYYKRSSPRLETDRERLLLAYQANDEVVQGRLPVSHDLAAELAALLAQIEYGDFRMPGETPPGSVGWDGATPMSSSPPPQTPSEQVLPLVVDRFYPRRHRSTASHDSCVLERTIAEKWCVLKGRPATDCIRIYLTVLRKWPFFGAKLFFANVKYGSAGCDRVWLAIQDSSVAILEYPTLRPISTYAYEDVMTFGGYREDFMLVISVKTADVIGSPHTRADRLLFTMRKPKMLELTMLMASYINSRGQHRMKIGGLPEKRSMQLTLSSTSTQMLI